MSQKWARQRLSTQGSSQSLSRAFISDGIEEETPFIYVPRDVSFRGSAVQCDRGARSATSRESVSRSSFLAHSNAAANDVICHSGNTLPNQPIDKSPQIGFSLPFSVLKNDTAPFKITYLTKRTDFGRCKEIPRESLLDTC